MKNKLMQMLEDRKDEIIQIRRHLHENPELSFKEEKTSKYIEDFYKGKDVQVDTKVGGGNGIIVTIKGGKPGKTIGLRADFDALPIKKKQMYRSNRKILVSCMPVDMMVIQLTCSFLQIV